MIEGTSHQSARVSRPRTEEIAMATITQYEVLEAEPEAKPEKPEFSCAMGGTPLRASGERSLRV
jgi:hypothetical protein